MGQSKLGSFVEAVVNTFIGLLIAFFAQWLIVWAYSIPLSHKQNFIIVFWMTVVSILRSYVVRRMFNRAKAFADDVELGIRNGG